MSVSRALPPCLMEMVKGALFPGVDTHTHGFNLPISPKLAGHPDEHAHDVKNAISLRLNKRHRQGLARKPRGQSYTRCQQLSILKRLKSTAF